MASPTPSSRKPTRIRRREIAQAALEILGTRGSNALTAASIAEAVGLTSGALFRHFASLEEVLVAAVALAVERVEETFPAAELGPLERVRALTRGRVELLGSDAGLAWLLLSDEAHHVLPEAGLERLRGLVQHSRSFLVEALREAAAQGELRDDLAPEALLPILTGTVHSLIAARGVHRGAKSDDLAPEVVLDALFQLLTPTSS